MSRQIYLPELLSINIKNYTLYPNGLDYTFDFVKGVNLVLGGNGMGKPLLLILFDLLFSDYIKAFWIYSYLPREYYRKASIVSTKVF